MDNKEQFKHIIEVLRKGTPEELGKCWREYSKTYKQQTKTSVQEFEDFVYSKKSALPDLDMFDGKI